jgi:hypothetical protein
MPFPCNAVRLRVYILFFPFNLHSAAMFGSHMPCHVCAMPRSSHSERDFSQRGMGMAWHGMCELASVIQGWRVPMFGFFRLPHGVPRRLLSEAHQSVKL